MEGGEKRRVSVGFSCFLHCLGGLAFAASEEYLRYRLRVNALRGRIDEDEWGIERLKGGIRKLEQRIGGLETVVISPEFQLFQERMKQIRAKAVRTSPQLNSLQTSSRGAERREQKL